MTTKAALPKRHEIRDAVKGRGYSGKFSSRGQAWYTRESGLWKRGIGFAYNGEAVSVIYRTDSKGPFSWCDPSEGIRFSRTLTLNREQLGDIALYIVAIDHALDYFEGRIN